MKSSSLQEYLESVHRTHAANHTGEVASYIPELQEADPAWLGIALITIDGQVYQAGDTRQPFTIQSISKTITYGIALEDRGIEAVLQKVDVEPSGEAFNEISLEPGTGRPRNSMINAGAIATVALVSGETPELKLERILRSYERYLGHLASIDEDVYRSEKATGHRNRAIAYLLHNSNIIEKGPDEILDVYFKQCSILVTCRDLALIGATLANDGVNPVTSQRALQSAYVPAVLSVMSSCGMYDYSGAWIYEIGMPAKSGVGGGIMAVLPGQFGLAVFSPRLDERGNSARGIAVCKQISADFGLHMFQAARSTAVSVIRARYDGRQVHSKRARNSEHTNWLAAHGKQIVVLESQGDLVFASAEIICREATRLSDDATYLILDFSHVSQVNRAASMLLLELLQQLADASKVALLCGLWQQYDLVRRLRKRLSLAPDAVLLRHEDLDHALEWCEDQLLAVPFAVLDEQDAALARQALCSGLTADELAALAACSAMRSYAPGEWLCRAGAPADALFFILSGRVSVSVPLGHQRPVRLATLSGGLAFGELALLGAGERFADVVAETAVRCLVLPLTRLGGEDTALGAGLRYRLLQNMARGLAEKLQQATEEIRSLRR